MIPRRQLDEFTNDAGYVTQTNRREGKRQYLVWMCPYYKKWIAIKERTANENFLKRCPTYADVSCCTEWLLFSNFKAWMEEQPWEHGKLYLDKDLRVPGNKVYSPDACRFVPVQINNLLLIGKSGGTSYPLGVSPMREHFRSSVQSGGKLIQKCFKTVEEAHASFQFGKEKSIRVVVDAWQQEPSFDQKIAENLLAVADMLRYDREEGRETISYFPLVERT